LWGEVVGDGGPGGYPGDGEVAAYDSTYVQISNMNSVDSGTSGIYFVNCDNCSISGVIMHRARGWGLDIVGGSDNFTASNNTIKWSWDAGSVFDGRVNLNGSYVNNYFESNNESIIACNGIAWIANPPSMSGNSAVPPPSSCQWTP
jgi:hypothetical protein